MLQMYENRSFGAKRNSVVIEMKCKNCNHEIVELSPFLHANRKYAHLCKRHGATLICDKMYCACSNAQKI